MTSYKGKHYDAQHEMWWLLTAYWESENPLFLREMWRLHRRHQSVELPGEVWDYLDACAAALLAKNEYMRGGTPDLLIARVFGFKKNVPPNTFKRRADYLRDRRLRDRINLGARP